MASAVRGGLVLAATGAAAMLFAAVREATPQRGAIVVTPGGTPRVSAGDVASMSTLIAGIPASKASAAEARRMEFLVPAYFSALYAPDQWTKLIDAATRGVPIVAILNPSSGPGTANDEGVKEYRQAIKRLRAAGGVVLGYVPTGNVGTTVYDGCKSSNVKTYSSKDIAICALIYDDIYNIDGIFLDQMAIDNDKPVTEKMQVRFYQRVYSKIAFERQNKANPWRIFGNPGTNAPQRLLRAGGAGAVDTIVTFERPAAEYAGWLPEAYTRKYDAHYFASILHTAKDTFGFRAALKHARQNNVRYIYATDKQGPPPDDANPYDRLPSEWETQGNVLLAVNGGE